MPSIASPSTPTAPGLVAVDGRTFPLREARLTARAQGGLAATTLVQEFFNPYAEPLEVLYTMPLPADGAVAGYTFRLGERVVTGRIETREIALESYRRALEEGRTGSLLEQERADTFTQSLGNVPAGASVTVEIEVLHPLAFVRAGGAAPSWEWRFPTVVGVRYEGAPGCVPDASKLDAPRADSAGTPVRMETELVIADGDPTASAPVSPSHEVAVSAQGAATRVTLGAPSKLDRDVVVRWTASSSSTEARLVEGPGLPGDDGRYALLTITPPAAPDAVFARDLTVLIDASGSMDGAPIAVAKKVVADLLASLDRGDRFEVLAFSSDVRSLTNGVVPASADAVLEATQGVSRLAAGGSTEMVQALTEAVAPLRRDAQRQVVLVTDGYIGFESDVVARVLAGLPKESRLHVAGIGSAPNRSLTCAAARAGRGVEVLVGRRDDAAEAASRLVAATARPVLTGVTVSGAGVRAVATPRPRDVLAGDALTLLVELAPAGGPVEVRARAAGSGEPWVWRALAEPAATYAAPLPLGAFFGRACVEELEMQLSAAAHARRRDAIAGEIEALGLRHRIVTRRTSLVAVSEDPTVDPRDPRRRQTLPVELPHAVSAEGVGLATWGIGLDEMRARAALLPFDTLSLSDLESTSPEPGSGIRSMSGLFERWRRKAQLPFEVDVTEPVIPRRIAARLLRVEADTLVFELEVPEDGFEVPADGYEATVIWASGETETVHFVAGHGTRPGHYEAGLTVRLAVACAGTRPDRPAPSAVLWLDASGSEIEIDLHAAQE